MAFKRNLYSKLTKKISGNGGQEIDLRQELGHILYGGDGLLPHGKKVLLRVFRLDADDNKIKCTCYDEISTEGSPECNFCSGEGAFWDEEWVTCYSTYVGADGGLANRDKGLKPGVINVTHKVFYFDHDVVVRYCDKIVEVKLDKDGKPVVPYKRDAIYKPQTIKENRSDYGRLEFTEVYCVEKDAIRRKY